jgi:hypothetical protein
MSYAQLDCLREAGIGAILNLCGEFCDLHDIECAAGFEVYHMPLADEEAPELAELEKALAWLDEAIYLGKKVLIHCRHGIGRTGTVLNAYLLRRGLGHRLAWFKLRTLRSKPANFAQWWTIRKYGRQSPKLTVREPSLEMHKAVDLNPFFRDYEALQARLDDESGRVLEMCGRDHFRCCGTPIQLTMVEAVYITQKMNVALTSEKRLEVIGRAVETARRERLAESQVRAEDFCLSDADARCPLLEGGKCIPFPTGPCSAALSDWTRRKGEAVGFRPGPGPRGAVPRTLAGLRRDDCAREPAAFRPGGCCFRKVRPDIVPSDGQIAMRSLRFFFFMTDNVKRVH